VLCLTIVVIPKCMNQRVNIYGSNEYKERIELIGRMDIWMSSSLAFIHLHVFFSFSFKMKRMRIGNTSRCRRHTTSFSLLLEYYFFFSWYFSYTSWYYSCCSSLSPLYTGHHRISTSPNVVITTAKTYYTTSVTQRSEALTFVTKSRQNGNT